MFIFRSGNLSSFVNDFRNKKVASNNLDSFLKIFWVPSDDTFRYALRTITTEQVNEIIRKMQYRLERQKILKPLLFEDMYYLVALDGTGQTTSKKIKYQNCITKKRDKDILYMHYVLNAVLTDVNANTSLTLAYEPLSNEDKNGFFIKNDCELTGSKRLLKKMKRMYPKRKFCFLCDNLYAVKPFFKEIIASGWHCIATAKPERNKELFKNYNSMKDFANKYEFVDEKGNKHVYQWINSLPLIAESKEEDFFYINIVEYWEYNKNGKKKYYSSWTTDISITKNNVVNIAKAGRARFGSIENRCFNEQKSLGYGLDHNYGHKGNLPSVFFGLIQIAHIISELFSKWKKGKALIRKVGSKKRFFEKFSVLLSSVVVPEHPMPILYIKFQWDTS